MLSLTHMLLLLVVVLLFVGPSKLPRLGKSLGEGMRNFKKGLRGEGDIDVTDSVRRLDEKDPSSDM
jgi:sec-independent protein translocase protein TatA